ncbi:UNVERIFIED_CONTAM: hypothetical protein HDU68_010699 [Siphonaria sp. JEL0065]|nr:hypothetical protein HDU68_010699 [Siphonaria sp. JEL0065]
MASPTSYSSFKRTVHIPGNHALPPGISNQVAWELSYARSDPNDPSTPPSQVSSQHPEHSPQPFTMQDPTGVLQGLRVTERELLTLKEWDKMLGGSSAVNAAAAMLFEASGGCGTSLATNPGVKFGFTNEGGYLSPHVIQMQMLSRMYASTGAAAWGAGRRGIVRVPVGGWPSGVTGVEFGMGMKTIPLPPKDGQVAKIVEDVRGPLVGNAGAVLQAEIRKLDKLDKDGQLELPDNSVVRAERIQSRLKSEVEAKAEFEKLLVAEDENEKLQDGTTEADQQGENGITSPDDDNIRWLEWAAALIANANNLKSSSKQQLEPLATVSTLPKPQAPMSEPNIKIRPHTANKRPQSARSKARNLQPLPVQHSSAPSSASRIPYAVNSPNPPPGPPGSADSIVVSNPAHLPLPYASNRRFHSNPIHPDYLVSSDLPLAVTHGNPNFPQVYHKESIYMTEFSSRMQIPAKYVAAFNIAARVNGRPLAQAAPGTESERVGGISGTSLGGSSGTTTTPSNLNSNYESTFGYGYGSIKSTPPPAHSAPSAPATPNKKSLLPPRRPRPPPPHTLPNTPALPLPAKGAPAILGPLVGSSKVLTSDDWHGFQGIQKGVGVEGTLKLVSGLSGRDGGEMYHGIPPCLGPEAVSNHWNALLTLPGPVGRRGWNHVGRGNTLFSIFL